MINERSLALEILVKTISDESYSNLLMRSELNKLEPYKRGFVTELVNGVLRNYEYLDYHVSRKLESKTKFRTRLVLLLAFYEKFFLMKEDYVIVNEYADIISNKYEKSFVNAFLRNNLKLEELPEKESEKGPVESSLPSWIYNLLKKQYDAESFEKILKVYKTRPQICYRINLKKAEKKSFESIPAKWMNDKVFTCEENLIGSRFFKEGLIYVQDFNSSSLVDHLPLKENDSFLDLCSAPGSKLFNALDAVKEENCYANDLYDHRVELIKKKASVLGFSKIHFSACDARTVSFKRKFNCVLIDAPCSGLGVIGRKPDIKFHIKPNSLDEIEMLQREILENASNMIEEDGYLMYSTCTLNKKENEKQIAGFIHKHNEFKMCEENTIINDKGDCFYYALLKRV